MHLEYSTCTYIVITQLLPSLRPNKILQNSIAVFAWLENGLFHFADVTITSGECARIPLRHRTTKGPEEATGTTLEKRSDFVAVKIKAIIFKVTFALHRGDLPTGDSLLSQGRARDGLPESIVGTAPCP